MENKENSDDYCSSLTNIFSPSLNLFRPEAGNLGKSPISMNRGHGPYRSRARPKGDVNIQFGFNPHIFDVKFPMI